MEAVRSTVAKKSTIKSGRRANPVHFSRPKSAIIYALSEDEVKKAYTDKVQSSGVKKDERLGLINLLDKKVLRTTITVSIKNCFSFYYVFTFTSKKKDKKKTNHSHNILE